MEDNMIFLSHNYKDKPVVEQIAIRLKAVYGQDNVFYDSWSIQPGDGIIDKMEQGLSNCKFFFYFVSINSLQSNMVKLEWQNALFKAAQNVIKFIPIRMDNSTMPILLMQSLYIDLYSNGIDVALRQMIDVINGINTYRNPTSQFSNLVAYKYREKDNLIVECKALYYLEPISHFAFCTQTPIDLIRIKVRNELICTSSEMTNATLDNGYKTNVIARGVEHGTTPEIPFVVEFSSVDGTPIDIDMVLHRTSGTHYTTIPLFSK